MATEYDIVQGFTGDDDSAQGFGDFLAARAGDGWEVDYLTASGDGYVTAMLRKGDGVSPGVGARRIRTGSDASFAGQLGDDAGDGWEVEQVTGDGFGGLIVMQRKPDAPAPDLPAPAAPGPSTASTSTPPDAPAETQPASDATAGAGDVTTGTGGTLTDATPAPPTGPAPTTDTTQAANDPGATDASAGDTGAQADNPATAP